MPQDTSVETWRPIPRFANHYEASDHGRIRSLPRKTLCKDGIARTFDGRILKPVVNTCGRHQVFICIPGEKQRQEQVHRLVLETFVGPCPEGMEACHRNDDASDNRLSNLRWDSRAANMQDRVANGLDPNVNKTHCPQGHPYDLANTYVSPSGRRHCRTCTRAAGASYVKRNPQKMAEKQRRMRARRKAQN